MREELKEIEKILQKNGWVQAAPTQPDEMTEFVKNTADDDVVGIEIALEKTSLPCYGRYGIGCIQIVKYGQPAPYIRDDIRNMEKIILDAEKELLNIGVPFRPTYGFGFALENNLGRNLDLREKYNLDQFEKEDWRNDVVSDKL